MQVSWIMQKRAQRERIEILKKRSADLEKRLPAHSVKPHQFAELERLEEELAALLKGG